ncbi:MAG: IS110 family transposase [Leptolyngbyaceae bacterium]|nr:IS110 family transposase [Leptolyngbyaceae bacterium]
MKNTTPTQSYDGEHIYVGIDVHKKTYVVVARIGQTIVKKWSTAAKAVDLATQLLKYFKGGNIHTVYEAGFSGFVLHRELSRHGIDSIVVHAAAVEVAVHNRVKTDKRDADKLSSQLEAGRLRGIRVPTPVQEHRRMLSRTRTQLVQERAAIKNQIRMKAHQLGLIEPEDRREMSHQMVKELLSSSCCEEFKIAVQAHWQIWQALDEQIKQLTVQLKRQAESDPYETTYRSAPGVGAISARVLSNELGDLSAFANERQLFSYTGLTPTEHSSGEQTRRGHISKQGNRYLRAILLEIAWRAVRKDPDLQQFFERLHPRTGKKRAIVAVARKLIGRIRAAFRKGEPYQTGYETSPLPAA